MNRTKIFLIRCISTFLFLSLHLSVDFSSFISPRIIYDHSLRRLRSVESDLIIGEINLGRRWSGLISSGRYPMLDYADGKIRWVTQGRGDRSLRIEEKRLGNYIVEVNEVRSLSLSVKEYAGCDLCGLTQDTTWRDIGVITLDSGGQWKIVGNLFPWERLGSFVFLPILGEHQGQFLTPNNIRDIVDIMTRSKNLFLIFNGWGAGASQNHIHIQGAYKRVNFPIENLETEVVTVKDGITISRYIDYPARGLIFTGEDKVNLAEKIFQVVNKFQSKNIPLGVLFVNDQVVVFPRETDIPPELGKIKFGTPEMAGRFIFYNSEDYDAMTEDRITLMLDRISLSWTKISQALKELGLI